MPVALARTVSILGHPLALLSLALLALVAADGDGAAALRLAAWLAALEVLVLGYSWWRVRRGHWRHVDASGRDERRTLNRFLLAALCAGAALAWLSSAQAIALVLLLSAAVIALALLSARWCTLSLHLAFAVFSALLLLRLWWPAGAALLVLVPLLAWSRLALSRHVPRDLWAGAAAGAGAGLAAWPAGAG